MLMIENPFKEGYLWFPPHGVLGQLKKSWHKKYCQLFKCSKHGIDRLEVFDSEEEVGKTSSNLIITLENCIKITQDAQKHQSNVFAVITKTSSYYFSTNSEEEMQDWIYAFQMVAFKDNVSRQTIEEDNDLYCSSGDAGVFSVRLVPSDASIRCGLTEGYYILTVTPVALQLHDSDQEQLLYTWPYRYIRRYGYRSGKFTFEAGRKCESGEGVFHFEHSNQQEIFRCISSKMKNMKKLLNGETPSPVVCSENQFQVASLMVARSRSPLPPSPNGSTTTRILDSDLCPIPSVKPLMPFPAYTSNSSLILSAASVSSIAAAASTALVSATGLSLTSLPDVPPPLMPKSASVNKSMRKLLPPTTLSLESAQLTASTTTDNNTQLSYDDVDVRRLISNGSSAMLLSSSGSCSSSSQHSLEAGTGKPPPPPPAPPVATSTTKLLDAADSQKIFSPISVSSGAGSLDNYDHLHHLGAVPKQSTAPGYKQIPLIMKTTSVPSFSIEEPIFPCRRADDFQGYGMIRKKSMPDIENDLSKPPYAMVCKPNRV